jgi:uncharacterized protein YdhG (YjbR/CyaY superfamily)
MAEKMVKAATIDAYIAQFPQDVQDILQKVRALVREVAPQAKEKISYGMPGFDYHGSLVWFAGFKHHIGFYPTGEGIEAFKAEILAAGYKFSKGAVQFPLDQPLPYDLMRRMVQHRMEQNSRE